MSFVSTKACPTILPEQKAFLQKVFEIPFKERSWKKLVNLDTLHAYCGGPIATEEAWRLDRFSRIRKFLSFVRHDFLF